MSRGQLLEPQVATRFRLALFSTVFLVFFRFHVLQVLLDHVLGDLEAFGDDDPVGQLEVVRQFNALRQSDSLGQLVLGLARACEVCSGDGGKQSTLGAFAELTLVNHFI